MFNIGISRGSSLLLVCTGSPQYNDFLALIDLAAHVSAREKRDRVLVDCSSLAPVFSLDERTFLGTYAGKVLTGIHVALVVTDVRRFFSTQFAAAQSGGRLRYFTTLAQAGSWLETLPVDGPSKAVGATSPS